MRSGGTLMLVRVLGSVEASNGERIVLRGATHRRLIASLALSAGEVVSLDRLVEITWPDGDVPAQAERNVRTYVHRLRGALGPDLADRIETVEPGYRIRLEPGELDAEGFDELASRAGRVGSAGDAMGAIALVDEAVGLWRGRPLGEFADESWARPTVERLAEVHVRLRELRAESLIAVGRAGEAVTDLEELVRELPLREKPRGLLMQALYDDGRQVDALRVFHEFRRGLIDEVGVEPTAELAALDRAIASGDSELLRPERKTRTLGAYELHEQVGEGAFSVVYRGTQTGLGRDVAVKAIRAELANRPEFIRRFEAEAQMVAGLEHPHIVPLHDFWREPDTAYLVMRWLPGGTLQASLDDGGGWSLSETVRMIEQVGSGLGFAHRAGVVHRDVNPANIMLDADGNAFLTDFGIAIEADEGPTDDVRGLADVARQALTAADPEQARPRAMPDAVTEVLTRATEDGAGGFTDVASFMQALATAAALTDPGLSATAPGRASIDAERTAQSADDADNPYKGLRAFDEGDAGDFYGRERLIRELIDRLAGDGPSGGSLLAVVGPSGSGKSSVVRAGLLPAVRGGSIPGSERWFATSFTPGAHPFESLETALLRVAVNPPASLLDQLTDGPRGIVRGVRRVLPDDTSPLLVVIDQFEELFTLCDDETVRAAFLKGLAAAASAPDSPVRIVVTLRADFYDRPLRYPEFAALMKQNSVTVTPLSGDELESAIVGPVASVGVDFEAGLVAQIVAEVASQPGALPLLQYSLTELFEARKDSTLRLDDYRELGGLTGALARRADELYASASEPEQASIRALFGRLITLGEGAEDTRRRARLSEVAIDPPTEKVIDTFGSARLITFDRDVLTREPTVEVAHEALIREWPRLREWLDEDRQGLLLHRHLTSSAASWADRGRDAGELYSGVRLGAIEAWTATADPALNSLESEFLEAGIGRRDAEELAERNRVRRLRRLLVVTGVVAVVALAAGALALRQQQRADDQAALADQNAELANTNAAEAATNAAEAATNAELANSNAVEAAASADLAEVRAQEAEAARLAGDLERMGAVALAVEEDSPHVAALLAVEAHSAAPSVDTLTSLHRALTAVPGFRGTFGGRAYLAVELLDDGVTLAAVGVDSIDVWDLANRELLRTIAHDNPVVTAKLVASPDGRVAAIRGELDETSLYDLTTGDLLGVLSHPATVSDLSLSRDGSSLVVALAGGRVELWDLATMQLDQTLNTGEDDVSFARWNPVEDRLAVVTFTSEVQYWDPVGEEVLWVAEAPEAALINQNTPFAVTFTPAGDRLVLRSGSLDARLRILDTTDGSSSVPAIGVGSLEGFSLDAMFWIDPEASILGAPHGGGVVSIDLLTGSVTTVEAFINRGAGDVVFVPKLGQTVAATSAGLEVWAADDTGPLEQLAPYSPEQLAAVTVGGGVLPSLSADGSELLVSVFSATGPPPVTIFDLTSDPLTSRVFSADGIATIGYGAYTLTAGFVSGVQILDSSLSPLGPPVPFPFDFTELSASPDGSYFALGRLGGHADLYTGTGEFVGTVSIGDGDQYEGAQTGPSFSADGAYMSVVTTRGGFGLWTTDPLQRVEVPNPGDWVSARLMGEWVFMMRADGTTIRVDRSSFEPIGEPLLTFLGYSKLDEEHLRVADQSAGEVIKVWDLETGLQLGGDLPWAGAASRYEFTEDGSVLSVPEFHGITLWNFDTDTWADIACEMAGRNLTAEEWDQFGPRTIERRATCPQYPLD